tara:strand:- start:193 stop:459 length:267 start_codon:yes stop_codon:yes gene_type:complete
MFKKNKTPTRKAPNLHANKQQREAWEWCIRNKIGICVLPDWNSAGQWFVEITINDKITVDPKTYRGTEAMNKMYEYCKYYKNKYENTL